MNSELLLSAAEVSTAENSYQDDSVGRGHELRERTGRHRRTRPGHEQEAATCHWTRCHVQCLLPAARRQASCCQLCVRTFAHVGLCLILCALLVWHREGPTAVRIGLVRFQVAWYKVTKSGFSFLLELHAVCHSFPSSFPSHTL